jgi:hypothetical protein
MNTGQPNQREQINQESFQEVIRYYNCYAPYFLAFEKETGINLWFLNHFRTYFSYRNQLIDSSFTNTENDKNSTQKGQILKKFSALLSELRTIFRGKKPPSEFTVPLLVFSNVWDITKGTNKRLGELANQYPILYNRPLLDLKRNDIRYESENGDSDGVFYQYALSSRIIPDIINFRRKIDALRSKIAADLPTQTQAFTQVHQIFWSAYTFYFIIFLRYKAFDRFFRKNNIKGILLSDENSPQQKVIQYAALKHSVKVFALQHGNIHLLHPAYIYGSYHTKPALPTKTFTWGSYFTELLVQKGGYPAHQLSASGKVSANLPRKLHPKLNTEDNIILYASQPQRDEGLRRTLLADILKVVKTLHPKYKLVIRPHPNEKDDSFFTNIGKKAGFTDFLIDRETDLETHFEVCSLLIIAFSTVGTEFIPHYKPMLVLDYLHQDLINWIKEGVGIPVRSQEDLLKILQQDSIEIDTAKYRAFIERYYKVGDGVIADIKKTMEDELSV